MVKKFGPLLLVWAVAVSGGCISKRSGIEEEQPRVFDKPGSNSGTLPRPSESESGELYLRKKVVSVVPLENINKTGSLFNVDDERNYLFAARGPLTPGRFIDVMISSNKIGVSPAGEKSVDKPAAVEKKEAFDDELMKSLPDLEPSSADAKPIHRFKMKIAHRYPNGDVLAVAQRQSITSQDHSDLSVKARIPYDRLISGVPLTTEDLTEITMTENSNGESIDRRSGNWEDEYTLRMSGFNEASSKVAARLDQQRDQLRKIRDELKTRLVALGKEREQMAGERNKLMEKNTTSQTIIDGLNKALLDKDAQIKTQQDVLSGKEKEIEGLKPKVEVPK